MARVIGGGADSPAWWAEGRKEVRFETAEVLRGSVGNVFSVPNGVLGSKSDLIQSDEKGDFNGHRDLIYWDKDITRQWNQSDCRMHPMFFPGRTYLIFLNSPHWRAYEEIRAPGDLWLMSVRRLLQNPSANSGLGMKVPDWLSMAQGVFIGQIESCKGPTLRVQQQLFGGARKVWRYSDDAGDSYWPLRCHEDARFLVIVYRWNPSPLPYYSSSVFPIVDGEIDLSSAISRSQINIRGPRVWKIEDLVAQMKQ